MNKMLILFSFALIVILVGCATQIDINYVEPILIPITEDIIIPETATPEPTAVPISETPEEPNAALSKPIIPDIQIPTADTWEAAYEALLQIYSDTHEPFWGVLYYLIYDIDLDGTPELIIVGFPFHGAHWHEAVDVVYTYRDGRLVKLEYGDDVSLMAFFLSVRVGVETAPNNEPDIITYEIGPSAGEFGTSSTHWRFTVDGDKLIVAAYGMRFVDFAVLHEMFTDFGRGYDNDILYAAIYEHTHWYLNGERVAVEEFTAVFRGGEPLRVEEFSAPVG